MKENEKNNSKELPLVITNCCAIFSVLQILVLISATLALAEIASQLFTVLKTLYTVLTSQRGARTETTHDRIHQQCCQLLRRKF